MPLDDSRRIERELRASVIHFQVLDLLLDGDGVDRRSPEELAWELAWRRTPDRPKLERPEDVEVANWLRDFHRHLARIPDDVWAEIY